jgi:hypothetical protein
MMRRSIPVIKSLATRDEPSASAANFAKLVSALPNAMRSRVFHGQQKYPPPCLSRQH